MKGAGGIAARDLVHAENIIGLVPGNQKGGTGRPNPVTGQPRQPPGFKPDPSNNVTGKPRSVNKFLDDAEDFLGKRYTQGSDRAYYSKDGKSRVRFTDSALAGKHGDVGSNGHFEFNGGRNIHIPLTDL